MIVGTVGFQLPPQMSFIENDNVIQALSPYGSDNPLDIRILPGRARGRKHFFDAETFHSLAKPISVDAVPVAYQVAWSRVEWEGFYYLLSSPFRSRMIRRVEVNNFSPFVMQYHKDIHDSECCRGNGEKVYGDQIGCMICEEGFPSLGGRLSMIDHVFGDSGFGYMDTEHQQFTMNSRCAPANVVP